MEQLAEYFNETLGTEVKISQVREEELSSLPLAYTNLYKLYATKIFNRNVLLVYVNEEFTTENLRKQLEIIEQNMHLPCIAVFDTLESFTRARLIEKKIQFIVPGKQMYLPEFLIDLKEFGTKPKVIAPNMQPSAQLLLLYHLQIESLEGINFKEIADKLLYNGMTITRAAYYLHNVGLCEIQGTKEKYLHFKSSKRKLWEEAEPLMSTPVKEINYYNGFSPIEYFSGVCYANITALSNYTDINPDVVEYFAVRTGYVEQQLLGPNFKKSNHLEGNICIEDWKYNPAILKTDRNVDPLSLYLCFRESKNERIEMAREQLIEKVEW
ncbi:MAG: hypothetical protein IPI10_18325 [Bacteroidetes bacterium]|jgi:hypothetical protein|nr:hypothetical protein [Bacteroidota bacterium]